MNLLDKVEHRPWPLPRGSWAMTQTWNNLLFAHWPVPSEVLRPLVPDRLELDTYDGQAWLGVISFRLSGIRLRWLPEVPFVMEFPEINVRTYVTSNGKPGVFFMSLDTSNPFTVAIGKRWFLLPYFRSQVALRKETGRIHFMNHRTEHGAPSADFAATYRPTPRELAAPDGSLER